MVENYISGASGFLGSHLAERVANYFPIPHEELPGLELQPFKNFYFCSAYGNMSFHTEDDKIIKANLLDALGAIQKATAYDFNSFVYVSTSSVKLPIQTMYSRSKEAAEKILLAYTEKYNLPIGIVRPYSVTGVGEQPQHLIPTLIRSCIEGEAMDFVSAPVHDFVDVEDVVSAITLISTKRAKGIFEVGNGLAYSNAQVLDLVEKITGKKANIKNTGRLRGYDTTDWVCRNKRLQELGWKPRRSLEDSIREMVRVYGIA